MDIREKLVELIENGVPCPDGRDPFGEYCDTCKYSESSDCANERLADYLISHGVTVQEWIPVTERLPKPEEEVWVQCERGQFGFKYQCNAFYIPPKWLREESDLNWDYECCDEYDEEADDYYVNEGWYERIHNWDDYSAVGIGAFVTHWMPKPQPPKGE